MKLMERIKSWVSPNHGVAEPDARTTWLTTFFVDMYVNSVRAWTAGQITAPDVEFAGLLASSRLRDTCACPSIAEMVETHGALVRGNPSSEEAANMMMRLSELSEEMKQRGKELTL